MKKLTFLFLLSVLGISFSNAQVVFDQIGVGTSYWIRTYSTPDENVLLNNPPTENGKSNPVIVPHIFARVKLGEFFGLRGKLGLAQDSYQSSVIFLIDQVRIEKVSQTIIPAGLLLDFSIPIGSKTSGGKNSKEADSENSGSSEKAEGSGSKSKTNLVGGVGVNRYFIQHTFSREVIGGEGSLPESKFSGNDFGITGMIGISNQISDRVVLTAFSQYNSGSYNHRVYSEAVTGAFDVKTISLQGLEFGISLGYKLGK
jgi:hypothetical protein